MSGRWIFGSSRAVIGSRPWAWSGQSTSTTGGGWSLNNYNNSSTVGNGNSAQHTCLVQCCVLGFGPFMGRHRVTPSRVMSQTDVSGILCRPPELDRLAASIARPVPRVSVRGSRSQAEDHGRVDGADGMPSLIPHAPSFWGIIRPPEMPRSVA